MNHNTLFVNVCSNDLFLALFKQRGHDLYKSEIYLNDSKRHSQVIFRNIEELLTEMELKLQDIDKVFVVLGPGSFMNMRLSLMIARTLSLLNKSAEIYTVSSFLYSYALMHLHILTKNSDWVKIKIAVRKTSNTYYTLVLDKGNIWKNEKWAIEESEDVNKVDYETTFLIKDFKWMDRKMILHVQDINAHPYVQQLITNYCTTYNQEALEEVMMGKNMKLELIDELLSKHSIFIKNDSWRSVKQLDVFQDLGI